MAVSRGGALRIEQCGAGDDARIKGISTYTQRGDVAVCGCEELTLVAPRLPLTLARRFIGIVQKRG